MKSQPSEPSEPDKETKGEPITPSGLPANYPDAKKLVTENCIQPAKV
jgi:hypothetical protein